MIIKNILSSNRSFVFARGPVPMRSRLAIVTVRCAIPLRGPVVVFLLLDLIAGTPAHYPLRRDGDIAPYRYCAREFCMRIIRTMRCAPRPRPVAIPHTRVPSR